MNWLNEMGGPIKSSIDFSAVGVLFLTVANYLPGVAAALTVVWFIIRIYNEILESQKKRKELKNLMEND
jgi:hypothetical protein